MAASPAQALEKAQDCVQILLGGFPEDVIPATIEFGWPPEEDGNELSSITSHVSAVMGMWGCFLERDGGQVAYLRREGIGIAYSERQGVALYADLRFSAPWQGNLISRDEAAEVARDAARASIEQKWKEQGRTPSLILIGVRGVYGPVFARTNAEDPRAVRACWGVLVPVCAVDASGKSERLDMQVMLDAETAGPVTSYDDSCPYPGLDPHELLFELEDRTGIY